MSAISINRLPQSYPFMETVRTEVPQTVLSGFGSPQTNFFTKDIID